MRAAMAPKKVRVLRSAETADSRPRYWTLTATDLPSLSFALCTCHTRQCFSYSPSGRQALQRDHCLRANPNSNSDCQVVCSAYCREVLTAESVTLQGSQSSFDNHLGTRLKRRMHMDLLWLWSCDLRILQSNPDAPHLSKRGCSFGIKLKICEDIFERLAQLTLQNAFGILKCLRLCLVLQFLQLPESRKNSIRNQKVTQR